MSVSSFVGPQCPYPIPFSQDDLLCTQKVKESFYKYFLYLFMILQILLKFWYIWFIGLRNVWFAICEKLFYKNYGKTDRKSLNFREQIL